MGKFCPLLKKDCIEHQCNWYIQVQGTNPQTNAPVNEWGCAVAWTPMFLLEVAKHERQTGAAVESLRNEQVKTGQMFLNAIAERMKQLQHKE